MDLKQNYFDVFGLPVSFDLDITELSERFVDLQKAIHPDRHSAGTDQEKRRSMQTATYVNTAHETLKSPLKRAIYLLKLKGVEIAHNPQLPPDFLMEQIELREDLEAIQEDASLDRLDTLSATVKSRMARIENKFGETVDSNLEAAETCVYELQFLNKLLQEARQLEEKLLDY